MNLHTYNTQKKIFKQKNILNNNYNKKWFNNNNTNLGHNKLKINTCIHNTLYNLYIGKKNNTFILNSKNIQVYLIKAFKFFIYILKKKGKVLVINTNPELSKLSYNLKKNYMHKNMCFINVYYTKGNLTNYKKIFFNIKTFINFYINYNEFLNYNKIHFAKYKKMKNNYKGFIHIPSKKKLTKQNLVKLYSYEKKKKQTNKQKNYLNKDWKPDLIVLLSTINVNSIVNEANLLNIPIIGFVEKNSSINKITYPIPNNISYYAIINFFFKMFHKIINKYTLKNLNKIDIKKTNMKMKK